MSGVALDEAQQDLVFVEAGYFSGRVQDATAQMAYRRLQESAAEKQVPEDLLGPLGEMLRVGLSTGRIRAVHGPHAELAATGLFRRTPQGKAMQREVSEVNAALAVLQGQALEKVSVASRGPGLHSVTVETDEARLVVSITPAGVEIRSVEVRA